MFDIGLNLLSNTKQSGGPAANMTREDLKTYLMTEPKEFNDAIRAEMRKSTSSRWFTEHGMFVFNASSPAQFWAKWMNMSLEGSAEKIRCPTLIGAGATDHFDPGAVQAKMLYNHLTCDKDLIIYSDEYGAGSHCQLGAFAQSFAGKFDWLDEKMGMRN